MTYGLKADGFNGRTYDDILADVEAAQRSRISQKLVLDGTTVLGNVNQITAFHLADVWGILEAVAVGLDPDYATGQLLVSLCKLTGVRRRAASRGIVTVTTSWSKAGFAAAGAVVLTVAGSAENRWVCLEDITASAAGDVDAVFISDTAGADATALAGTLTVIATGASGLVSATNALDAVHGADIESYEALRIRREQSVAIAGSATAASIAAAVVQVDGVLDVRVLENDTGAVDGDGLPPKSIEVVVWDGATPAADDDELAVTIYGERAAGVYTHGDTTVAVYDPWDALVDVRFSRATQVEIGVVITVTGTVSETAVKDAILGYAPGLGEDVIRSKLMAEVAALGAVDDVTSLTMQADGGPLLADNIAIGSGEKALLDSGRIWVALA